MSSPNAAQLIQAGKLLNEKPVPVPTVQQIVDQVVELAMQEIHRRLNAMADEMGEDNASG